jgi:hypothetical protein
MKIPKWQKGLTKKERDHIKEWGGRTLNGFKQNRESQKPMETGIPGSWPCFECREIARKLGLE